MRNPILHAPFSAFTLGCPFLGDPWRCGLRPWLCAESAVSLWLPGASWLPAHWDTPVHIHSSNTPGHHSKVQGALWSVWVPGMSQCLSLEQPAKEPVSDTLQVLEEARGNCAVLVLLGP